MRERVGIVGLGLIGGSLALALRRAHPGISVLGVDSDPRALQTFDGLDVKILGPFILRK